MSDEDEALVKRFQRTLIEGAFEQYERTQNCGIFVRNLVSWCATEEEILGRVRPEHREEAEKHIMCSRGMPKRLPCLVMGPTKPVSDTSGWLLPPYSTTLSSQP